MQITLQDLGNIYQLLEKAQVSGAEVEVVYNLKIKLISIMKQIQEATPKVAEEVKPTAETSTESLDMK